jgi:hypothetical protein
VPNGQYSGFSRVEAPARCQARLYLINLQATPTVDCFYGLSWPSFDTAEKDTHTALLTWYLNDYYGAQQNLNIIAGDFVESRGIVDLAIVLNRLMGAPGARVQAPGDPALYLIDSDGTRRHVPDTQTLVNLFGPTPTIINRPVSDITAGPRCLPGCGRRQGLPSHQWREALGHEPGRL